MTIGVSSFESGNPLNWIENNCTRFRYPTDDQLLICLLFQKHHSGLYSFNSRLRSWGLAKLGHMLLISVVPSVDDLELGGTVLHGCALLRLQCLRVCGFQGRLVKEYLPVTYLFKAEKVWVTLMAIDTRQLNENDDVTVYELMWKRSLFIDYNVTFTCRFW